MTSLTVENYLKAIYQLGARNERQRVATGALARHLGVSPGSVTSMLKALQQRELVDYQPYAGVELTERGRREALRVLRRHRLLELFLVETLGMSWDEVHAEAEHLEHAASDHLIDRIDEYLGHPQFDPHGDPIPRADGSVHSPELRSLAECEVGHRVEVARVLDQSPEFLQFVSRCGLVPGKRWQVTARDQAADVLTLKSRSRQITLSLHAAAHLLVKPQEGRG